MTEDLTDGLPAWLHPGKPVVWAKDGRDGGRKFVRSAKVERLTKTLIVLDNGERFSRRDIASDQSQVNRWSGGGFARDLDHLWRPWDERIQPLRTKIAISNARDTARLAVDRMGRVEDVETIIAARDALSALIEVMQKAASNKDA